METVAMVLELALLALVWFLGLPAACRVVPTSRGDSGTAGENGGLLPGGMG